MTFPFQTNESSIGTKSFISGRDIIRQAFLNKGASEEAVDVMVDSVTQATIKQYEGCLKKWLKFADERGVNAFKPL